MMSHSLAVTVPVTELMNKLCLQEQAYTMIFTRKFVNICYCDG